MTATADIFISHSSVDDEFGRAFAQSLRLAFQEKRYRGHEVTIWYDSTHIHAGDVWVEKISSALASCSIFILILSPAAIQSDWTFDEYANAKSSDKKIIPIIWVECQEILKTYKNGRWILLAGHHYATFSDSTPEGIDSQHIMAKSAFKNLCREIEDSLGAELQPFTEATVRSPEDHLMQQLLEVLRKDFRHERWQEVILLSDMIIQQMEAYIPAEIYYMRGVALQKERRYLESDVALALALALARPNVKEKDEKDKDRARERKDKEKEQRMKYLQARVETLQHIGGRWKEIYHTAQDAVSLLPEDNRWSHLAHTAQLELDRNPLLNTPPSPILLQKLSMHTFGTRTLQGATKTVESLAWSPNCEFLAAACVDGNVYVWRVKEVAEKPVFTHHEHRSYVTAVAWSPDGTQVASSSRDKTVHIWRVGEEKTIVWPHRDWVNDIAWSADGLQLASACQDRIVRIWDIPLQRQQNEEHMKHHSPVRTVAWHADGIHLAAGCDNGEVSIWNTQTGSEKRLLSAKERGCIYKLIWLPDSESLLAASADKQVHIWEQAIQGAASYQAVDHEHIVFALTHSLDGAYIASSDGEWVRVWEKETQKTIFTNGVHRGRVMALAWAPDDIHIASAGKDTLVQVWNFIKDKSTD